MAYVKLDTGEVLSEAEVRRLNPNVSFGLPLNDSAVETLGVKPIEVGDYPQPNDFEHVETDGIEEVNGVWQTKYVVVTDFPEYTDPVSGQVITTEQQIADYKAFQARMSRDEMLATTDRFALSDRTLSEDMRTYRQALRDVPAQAGFPESIVWPDRPEE